MATGDFDFKLDIDSKDEVGQLAKGVEAIQAAVQRMIADADLLARAAVDGKLATRADASKHQGRLPESSDRASTTPSTRSSTR
jgi:methyl-accepting chemotaxis protein